MDCAIEASDGGAYLREKKSKPVNDGVFLRNVLKVQKIKQALRGKWNI